MMARLWKACLGIAELEVLYYRHAIALPPARGKF